MFSKKCALAHVSFKVQQNECFGLLGVSGAGKTTAFNIITGQMHASDGYMDRMDIVGLCPQFDTLQPTFKGKQSLTILAKVHGYKDVKGVVEKLIEIADMEEHAKKQYNTCSGGQKKRLSVAAALLPRKSPFVILDEATAGIDPVARRDVCSVLSVVREHSTILMNSHSMEECDALCSRISILRDGQIAATGSSQELKSKLGNFYVLSMALSANKSKDVALKVVSKYFSGAAMQKGSFFRNMKWKLPRLEGDLWSNVFDRSQKIADELGASDFCVTQPSLQDIFLIIATNSDKKPDVIAKTDAVTSTVTTSVVSIMPPTVVSTTQLTDKSLSESTKKTVSEKKSIPDSSKSGKEEVGQETERSTKTQKSISGKKAEEKEEDTSSVDE